MIIMHISVEAELSWNFLAGTKLNVFLRWPMGSLYQKKTQQLVYLTQKKIKVEQVAFNLHLDDSQHANIITQMCHLCPQSVY